VFRSIRGGILLWYALILGGVLVTFGTTLYLKQRQSLLREVDASLQAHARAMAASIEADASGALEFEHSEEFAAGWSDGTYFVVWDRSGRKVDDSRRPGEVPRPEGAGIRSRGSLREVFLRGPAESIILVGRSIGAQKEYLRDLLKGILGVGLAVVLLALAGGWFLTGRAIRPIKRAFDLKTRFTADASHELRTPLSIVLAQAELALGRERSPEEYRLGYEITLQAAKRMKGVVDGLLTLARADTKDINLRKERVNLGAIVEEIVSLLRPLALERKAAMTAESKEVVVEGDPDRLREMLTNLLTNAIRYNRDGGRVDVALEADDEHATLTVKDTGIGIPPEEQPHVFERFHRVDKARSRDAGGSGLGLAITKWIVEAHDGRISFTSEEGKGTAFTVRLPLAG